jgi:hypothetical protein
MSLLYFIGEGIIVYVLKNQLPLSFGVYNVPCVEETLLVILAFVVIKINMLLLQILTAISLRFP